MEIVQYALKIRPHSVKEKTITLVSNNSATRSKKIKVNLFYGIKFSDISEHLVKYIPKPVSKLRLFNIEGVEIFEDELVFINHG
jgi:hypothetical protein